MGSSSGTGVAWKNWWLGVLLSIPTWHSSYHWFWLMGFPPKTCCLWKGWQPGETQRAVSSSPFPSSAEKIMGNELVSNHAAGAFFLRIG